MDAAGLSRRLPDLGGVPQDALPSLTQGAPTRTGRFKPRPFGSAAASQIYRSANWAV